MQLPEEVQAALNAQTDNSHAVTEVEYYSVYKKRGKRDYAVYGPHYDSAGALTMSIESKRPGAHIVQRTKTTSVMYGEFAPTRFNDLGDVIDDSAAHDLLRWLVSLDDPDNPAGLEERKTVTLEDVITRARAALEEDEET